MYYVPIPRITLLAPRGAVETSEIGPGEGAGDVEPKEPGDSSFNPEDPVQRYFGILIALLFVLLIFLLWVYFAQYPRRKLRQWGCTCMSSREYDDENDEEREEKGRGTDTMSGSQQHLGPLGSSDYDDLESQKQQRPREKKANKKKGSDGGMRPPSPAAAPLQSRDLVRYQRHSPPP